MYDFGRSPEDESNTLSAGIYRNMEPVTENENQTVFVDSSQNETRISNINSIL